MTLEFEALEVAVFDTVLFLGLKVHLAVALDTLSGAFGYKVR